MAASIVTIAPARICLFGDHQDYLGLPIIACAIDRYISLRAEPNDSQVFHIDKPDINEHRVIELAVDLAVFDPADHFLAALKVLRDYDCIPDRGYDLHITGNIPINAGVSSSSAVLITWIQFLVAAFGCNEELTQELIARIAYESEVAILGAPGGRMDQYAISLGKIIYLETDADAQYKLLGNKLSGLVVAESGIPKDTTGLLGEKKANALRAIEAVKTRFPHYKLANSEESDIPKLLEVIPAKLQPFLRAAISNHSITQRALEAFQAEEIDLEIVGRLMTAHHEVLRDELQITVPKIDTMINSALKAGALGAKIVGSGGGGSIAVLCRNGDEQKVIAALLKSGATAAFSTSVAAGAKVVEHHH